MAQYQGMNEGQPPAYVAQPNQQMIGAQQPIIIVPVTQPNTTTLVATNAGHQNRRDDPSCLYVR